jgi:hypothetical protein
VTGELITDSSEDGENTNALPFSIWSSSIGKDIEDQKDQYIGYGNYLRDVEFDKKTLDQDTEEIIARNTLQKIREIDPEYVPSLELGTIDSDASLIYEAFGQQARDNFYSAVNETGASRDDFLDEINSAKTHLVEQDRLGIASLKQIDDDGITSFKVIGGSTLVNPRQAITDSINRGAFLHNNMAQANEGFNKTPYGQTLFKAIRNDQISGEFSKAANNSSIKDLYLDIIKDSKNHFITDNEKGDPSTLITKARTLLAKQYSSGSDISEDVSRNRFQDADIMDALEQVSIMDAYQGGTAKFVSDPEKLDENIKITKSGIAVPHINLILDKGKFETAIDLKSQKGELTTAQANNLYAGRTAYLTRNYPAYDELFKDSTVEKKWQKHVLSSQELGISKAAILDSFLANPRNYSGVKNRIGSFFDSLKDSFTGLAFVLPALLKNETSINILVEQEEDRQNRKQVASIFGDHLGWVHDISTAIAPMVVDVAATGFLISRGMSVGGASYIGAKEGAKLTAKGLAKSFTGSILVKEFGETSAEAAARLSATKYIKEGASTKSIQKAIESYNSLVGTKLVNNKVVRGSAAENIITSGIFLTAANRSAGATYATIYSNYDGTHEEKHDKALGSAMLAGLSTGLITSAFSRFGRGGFENVLLGGLSFGQMNYVLSKLSRSKVSPLDAQQIIGNHLKSRMKEISPSVFKSLYGKYAKAGTEEFLEEGIDEFVNSFIVSAALKTDTPMLDRISDAIYAGSIGGVIGQGASAVRTAAQKRNAFIRGDIEIFRQREIDTLLSKLDATSSPLTRDLILDRFRDAEFTVRDQTESLLRGDDISDKDYQTYLNRVREIDELAQEATGRPLQTTREEPAEREPDQLPAADLEELERATYNSTRGQLDLFISQARELVPQKQKQIEDDTLEGIQDPEDVVPTEDVTPTEPEVQGKKTYEGFVTSLEPNQVFVFGSNLDGFHGAGSAGYASFNEAGNVWRKYNYGSVKEGTQGKWNIKGQAEGYQKGTEGRSYAIPTVVKAGGEKISEDDIKNSIRSMYAEAANNPEMEYLVANGVGRGLSGYTGQEFAKMYVDAGEIPPNVVFKNEFQLLIDNVGNEPTPIDTRDDFEIPNDGVIVDDVELEQGQLNLEDVTPTVEQEVEQEVGQEVEQEVVQEVVAPTTEPTVVYEPYAEVISRAAKGEGINTLRITGSEEHFGNPFRVKPKYDASKPKVVAKYKEVVNKYGRWLRGDEDFKNIEPKRRQWILNQIDAGNLDGQDLLYYTNIPDNHANELKKVVLERRAGQPTVDPELQDAYEVNRELLQKEFAEGKAVVKELETELSNIDVGYYDPIAETDRVRETEAELLDAIDAATSEVLLTQQRIEKFNEFYFYEGLNFPNFEAIDTSEFYNANLDASLNPQKVERRLEATKERKKAFENFKTNVEEALEDLSNPSAYSTKQEREQYLDEVKQELDTWRNSTRKTLNDSQRKLSDDAVLAFNEYKELENRQGMSEEELVEMRNKVTEEIKRVNKGLRADQYTGKELDKVAIATQFIGDGIERKNHKSSSLRYKLAWESVSKANTGIYSPDDVVMLAANGAFTKRTVVKGKFARATGKRATYTKVEGDRLKPFTNSDTEPDPAKWQPRGEYQNLVTAISSGASFIADTEKHLNKTKKYNKGELELKKYLIARGYKRVEINGEATGKFVPENAEIPLEDGDSIVTLEYDVVKNEGGKLQVTERTTQIKRSDIPNKIKEIGEEYDNLEAERLERSDELKGVKFAILNIQEQEYNLKSAQSAFKAELKALLESDTEGKEIIIERLKDRLAKYPKELSDLKSNRTNLDTKRKKLERDLDPIAAKVVTFQNALTQLTFAQYMSDEDIAKQKLLDKYSKYRDLSRKSADARYDLKEFDELTLGEGKLKEGVTLDSNQTNDIEEAVTELNEQYKDDLYVEELRNDLTEAAITTNSFGLPFKIMSSDQNRKLNKRKAFSLAKINNQTVVLINPYELDSVVRITSPLNRRAMIRAGVSEEIIHAAAIYELEEGEVQKIWDSLSQEEKENTSKIYYTRDESTKSYFRLRSDDVDTVNKEKFILGHEFLRMKLQKIIDGSTTEEIAVDLERQARLAKEGSDTAIVLGSFKRYLKSYFNKLFGFFSRDISNPYVAAALNRIHYTYKAMGAGYKTQGEVDFDPENPLQTITTLQNAVDTKGVREEAIEGTLLSSSVGADPIFIRHGNLAESLTIPIHTTGEYRGAYKGLKKFYNSIVGSYDPRLRQLHQSELNIRNTVFREIKKYQETLKFLVNKYYPDGDAPVELFKDITGDGNGLKLHNNTKRTIEKIFGEFFDELEIERQAQVKAVEREAKEADMSVQDAYNLVANVNKIFKDRKEIIENRRTDVYDKAYAKQKVEVARRREEAIIKLGGFNEDGTPKGEIANHLYALRKKVDAMSESIQKKALAGQVGTEQLNATIDNNLEVYLTTSYRLFTEGADYVTKVMTSPLSEYANVRDDAYKFFEKIYIKERSGQLLLGEIDFETGSPLKEIPKTQSAAEEMARKELYEKKITDDPIMLDRSPIIKQMMIDFLNSYDPNDPRMEGDQSSWVGTDIRPNTFSRSDDPAVRIIAKQLKQRANIPEELVAFMGKEKDTTGFDGISKTYIHTGILAANFAAMRNMLEFGTRPENGWILTQEELNALPEEKRKDKGGNDLWTDLKTRGRPEFDMFKLFAVSKNTQNLYVKKDMAEALKELGSTSVGYANSDVKRVSEAMVKWAGIVTGSAMGAKTLGSIGFYERNALGNMFFFAPAQGMFAPIKMTKALWKETKRKKGFFFDGFMEPDQIDPYYSKLERLGILEDELRPKMLDELIFGETAPQDMYKELNEITGELVSHKDAAKEDNIVRKLLKDENTGIGKIYKGLKSASATMDSFFKIYYFEYELNNLKKARAIKMENNPYDVSDAELEYLAAEKVKKTAQSYSESSPLVKGLASSPYGLMLAPFIRFKGELIRITVNSIKLIHSEMNDPNPVIKKRGLQRLTGNFTTLVGISAFLPVALRMFSGISDDEDEALRRTLVSYLRKHTYYIFKSGDDFYSLDLTYVNPYSLIVDPFLRTLEKGLQGESAASMGATFAKTLFADEFLDQQIFAGAFTSLLNNRDPQTDKKIWLERDTAEDAFAKGLNFLWREAFEPRTFRAISESATLMGTNQLQDALLRMGKEIMPAKPFKLDLDNNIRRYLYDIRRETQELSLRKNAVLSRTPMSDNDVKELVQKEIEHRIRLDKEVAHTLKHLQSMSGKGDSEMESLVKGSQFGQRRYKAIKAGRTETPAETHKGLKKKLMERYEQENEVQYLRRLKQMDALFRNYPQYFDHEDY